MDFYDFSDIRAHGSCIAFVRDVLGVPVSSDNRCAAVWRDGRNPNSVALTDIEWYDHARKTGGGLVELCAAAKFGGNIQQAQEFLGQWLRLEPKTKTKRIEPSETRYKKLIDDGYSENARYYYTDDFGNVVHIVVKMTHPKKHKEFLQRTLTHWGVKGVDLVLYNRIAWKDSPWVVVVEGEKDVETLKAWGIPATTNAGGAEKWEERWNELFAGKDVVVCRDNDEAGRDHARIVMKNLARYAKSLRLVCPSIHHKGDVTDWRDGEGGTYESFMRLITSAVPVPMELAEGTEEEWAVHAAKKANQTRFCNTRSIIKTVDGVDKRVEEARTIQDLIDDVHIRFLGFPHKIGDSRLFDRDRDSGRVETIDSPASLFAWIGRKSGQTCHWGKVAGCVSKEELFEGLVQSAKRYESISKVPDWPRRSDVYYVHPAIPPADPEHRYFERLISFFNPANGASRTLIRTLFAAPIFYQRGIPRPCWIIDSEDGAGTGKTTMVELLAELYHGSPIKTSKQELAWDFKELTKRVISSEGRKSRILLVDNVIGKFDSDRFADMVTSTAITGKAPYGRGEEIRDNNLTYVITANSANCNNDIASRSYIIRVRKPKISTHWKEQVMTFISEHRMHIFADLLDILNSHEPFDRPAVSRFPEFETRILQAMAGCVEAYDEVCADMVEAKSESNLEEELAKQVEETIRYRLSEMGIHPETNIAFLRTGVIDKWLVDLGDRGVSIQEVRNLSKLGLLKNVNKTIKRFPANEYGKHEGLRRTGAMWVGENVVSEGGYVSISIVGIDGSGKPSVVKALVYEDDKMPFAVATEPAKKSFIEQPEQPLELDF